MADNKEKIEQNDPKGVVLKSNKPDLLCGGLHQISISQPTVIIDSHMHIQSGRCSTEQFVQYQGPLAPIQTGLNLSRGVIEVSGVLSGGLLTLLEWIAIKPAKKVANKFRDKPHELDNPQAGYFEKNAVLELVAMQSKSTDVIADEFIIERKNLIDEYFKNAKECQLYENAPYLFFSSVVMTMDMEYSHIDGYFGLRIYNPLFEADKPIDVTKPSRYWTPAHGKWVETPGWDAEGNQIAVSSFIKPRDKTVYQKNGDTAKVVLIDKIDVFKDYKKNANKVGTILGSCHDPQSGGIKTVSIEAAPVLMSESEGKKYENWEKQLKSTEEAVIKYPLKFLPMFHYDPRRWQFSGENVITKVTGNNALYLGFKMYTAQGFRPWDVRRLPTLKDFYGRCCLNNIPIMNHCTPGGARSHEDDEYFNFEHPFDDEKEEQDQRKGYNAKQYFEEYFVSPNAWKKVLDSSVELEDGQVSVPLNGLRLCLAHFGGPAKPGPEWSQQIIDMITREDNKYSNLYTDISSSFADSGFRDYFKELFTVKLTKEQKKKMRSRILFGTDWYMIFAYGMTNKQDLWSYCTETKTWLDSFDTSLWPYFTQYNPYRFYRLESEVPRIAESIINKMNDEVVLEKYYEDEVEDDDDGDSLAYLIRKEAAWVKVSNNAHIIYEETPCIIK